jgi:hypothetical protein
MGFMLRAFMRMTWLRFIWCVNIRDDYDGKFVENGPNIVIHCAIKDMIVDSLSKLKTISRPLRHRRGS